MPIKIVLTGAPCAGKTTSLKALRAALSGKEGYAFVEEIPSQYITERLAEKEDPFDDLVRFERTVMDRQIRAEEEAVATAEIVFCDRSMFDHLAITDMLHIGKKEGIDVKSELKAACSSRNYTVVFMLERVKFVATADRREADESDVILQERFLKDTYAAAAEEMGFELIHLPVLPIDEKTSLEDSIANRIQIIIEHTRRVLEASKAKEAASAATGPKPAAALAASMKRGVSLFAPRPTATEEVAASHDAGAVAAANDGAMGGAGATAAPKA